MPPGWKGPNATWGRQCRHKRAQMLSQPLAGLLVACWVWVAAVVVHAHVDANTNIVVVSDGPGLIAAIEDFVQDGQHSVVINLVPSNASNVVSLRGVDFLQFKSLSARDLTIQGSRSGAPVILDCDMRERLVPEMGTGLLTVRDVVLINLCQARTDITDAEGSLAWASALDVPPLISRAQDQVVQNRIIANSTLYFTQPDLALLAYLIVTQGSGFPEIAQMASLLLEQLSNTNAVVTYADPWQWVIEYFSAPTLGLQNVTVRSLDIPAAEDPLLASLTQEGIIIPPTYCSNRSRVPPDSPFPEVDVHHGPMWVVNNATGVITALLRAAEVTHHRNITVLRDALPPAVLLTTSIQLSSGVLPAKPPNVTYPLLLTGSIATSSNPSQVQLDLGGLASVISLDAGGELYAQELALPGLASGLLDPTVASSLSVFPLQAFAPAGGWPAWLQQHTVKGGAPRSSLVWLHNITLWLPVNDYLSVVAMAYSDKDMLSADSLLPFLGQNDDQVHACLGPDQHAQLHRHLAYTQDAHPDWVGPDCAWMRLTKFISWGLNATQLTVMPAEPLQAGTLCMCQCIQRLKAPPVQEEDVQHARVVAAVVSSTVGALAVLVVGMAVFLVIHRRRQQRAAAIKPAGLCGECLMLCLPCWQPPMHTPGAGGAARRGSQSSTPRKAPSHGSSSSVGDRHASPRHPGSGAAISSKGAACMPVLQHAATDPGVELIPSGHISVDCMISEGAQPGGRAGQHVGRAGRQQQTRAQVAPPSSLQHVVATAQQLMGSCMDPITNDLLRAACAAVCTAAQQQQQQQPQRPEDVSGSKLHKPLGGSEEADGSAVAGEDAAAATGGDAAAVVQQAAAAQLQCSSSSLQEVFRARVAQRAAALGNELSNQVVVLGLLGQGGRMLYKGLWRGLPVALKTLVFRSTTPDGGLETALRAVSHSSSSCGSSSAAGGSADQHSHHHHGPGLGGQGQHARAIMEAAIAASVGHRNVVCTYHFDVQPIQAQQEAPGPGGLEISFQLDHDASQQVACEGHYKLYMVQELCATSLQSLLDMGTMRDPTTGAVDEMSLLWVLLDVACGLEYLHGRGIIHGDLKPANVLFKPDFECPAGVVAKLADFGLSHCLEPGATHVSNFQGGTPFFIAPEVISAYRTSPAADIYSYGVIMWHAFTGKRLYLEGGAGHLMRHPDFPHYVGPLLPRQLYVVLTARCLQPDPKLRPTASELVAGIRQLLMEAALPAAALPAALPPAPPMQQAPPGAAPLLGEGAPPAAPPPPA